MSVTRQAAVVASAERTVSVGVDLESVVALASSVGLEGGVSLARRASEGTGGSAGGACVGAVEAETVAVDDEA